MSKLIAFLRRSHLILSIAVRIISAVVSIVSRYEGLDAKTAATQ